MTNNTNNEPMAPEQPNWQDLWRGVGHLMRPVMQHRVNDALCDRVSGPVIDRMQPAWTALTALTQYGEWYTHRAFWEAVRRRRRRFANSAAGKEWMHHRQLMRMLDEEKASREMEARIEAGLSLF